MVFLDDVEKKLAKRIAAKYAALGVETSTPGGCHVWLRSARALDEEDRCQAQRWLAKRLGADHASISGEHLGRLAGFKNQKREGEWVNVVVASVDRPRWKHDCAVAIANSSSRRHRNHRCPGVDKSPSGVDWGFVCTLLEKGYDPALVYHDLTARAMPRRGHDTERYALRTMHRALEHLVARSQ